MHEGVDGSSVLTKECVDTRNDNYDAHDIEQLQHAGGQYALALNQQRDIMKTRPARRHYVLCGSRFDRPSAPSECRIPIVSNMAAGEQPRRASRRERAGRSCDADNRAVITIHSPSID